MEGWIGEENSSRLVVGVVGEAGVSFESGRSFRVSLARVASTILRAGDIPVLTVSALDERPMVLSLAAELVVAVLLALRMELAEEWVLALSLTEVGPLREFKLRVSTLMRMLLAASLSASTREVWG